MQYKNYQINQNVSRETFKEESNMFIAVEGISGSGKTEFIKERLVKMQSDAIALKETYPIKKTNIREAFLQERKKMQPIISKSYKENKYIFYDRYYFSTIVYNDWDTNKEHKQYMTNIIRRYEGNFLRPNLVIFLDSNPTIAFERISKRDGKAEFSLEKLIEHSRRFRKIFLDNKIRSRLLIIKDNKLFNDNFLNKD